MTWQPVSQGSAGDSQGPGKGAREQAEFDKTQLQDGRPEVSDFRLKRRLPLPLSRQSGGGKMRDTGFDKQIFDLNAILFGKIPTHKGL